MTDDPSGADHVPVPASDAEASAREPAVLADASPTPGPPSRRRRWPRVLMGCAALLLAVGGGTLLALYLFIRTPPRGDTESRITPTRDALSPSGPEDAQPGTTPAPALPEPTRTPGTTAAPTAGAEGPRSLEADAARRRRLSDLVQRRLRAGRRTPPPTRDAAAPVVDTTLPQPPALRRLEPGAAANLGPFLLRHFELPEAWALDLPQRPRTMRAADLDGDGQAELVFLDFDGRRLLFYDRRPDAVYRLRAVAAVDPFPQDVRMADFDADGRVDLLVPGGSYRTTLLFNRGKWRFEYRLVHVDWGASAAAVVDVGGDGFPDVYFSTSRGMVLFTNDGAGSLSQSAQITPRDRGRLMAGDLDGDRALDLIAVSWVDREDPAPDATVTLVYLRPDGRPRGPATTFRHPAPVWRLRPVVLHDGGPPGLVGTTVKTNEVILFRKSGAGTFAGEVIAKARNSWTLLVADITGDGREEVLAGPRLFITADGTLQPRARLPGELRPRALWHGPLTGDAVPDLALYDNTADRLLIYPGRASDAPSADGFGTPDTGSRGEARAGIP